MTASNKTLHDSVAHTRILGAAFFAMLLVAMLGLSAKFAHGVNFDALAALDPRNIASGHPFSWLGQGDAHLAAGLIFFAAMAFWTLRPAVIHGLLFIGHRNHLPHKLKRALAFSVGVQVSLWTLYGAPDLLLPFIDTSMPTLAEVMHMVATGTVNPPAWQPFLSSGWWILPTSLLVHWNLGPLSDMVTHYYRWKENEEARSEGRPAELPDVEYMLSSGAGETSAPTHGMAVEMAKTEQKVW